MRDTCTSIADKVILGKKNIKKCQMFSKMFLDTFDTFCHFFTEYYLISYSLNVLYIIFMVSKT